MTESPMFSARRTRRASQGFTLIELVVVIAILAALAGLVMAKVDFLRRQATMATGAVTNGDISNNIEMYLTTNSTLPNGFDSLLVGTVATSGEYSSSTVGSVIPSLIGTYDGVGSLPSALTTASLGDVTGDKRLNSLFRMGMSFVNDHNMNSSATDSGTVQRIIGTIAPAGPTGTLVPGENTEFAVVVPGSSIWTAVYPKNVWGSTYEAVGGDASADSMVIDAAGDAVTLVALGVGPGNSMNGVTMTAPPQYAGPDSNLYYYRYVAIFAVYTDGRRAQLKEVVDSFGRTVDSGLSNYSSAAPDDVPPGSRTPE